MLSDGGNKMQSGKPKNYKCWFHYDDKNNIVITNKPIHAEDEIEVHLSDYITIVTERNMRLKKIPPIEVLGWNSYAIWGKIKNGMAITYLISDIVYIFNM